MISFIKRQCVEGLQCNNVVYGDSVLSLSIPDFRLKFHRILVFLLPKRLATYSGSECV